MFVRRSSAEICGKFHSQWTETMGFWNFSGENEAHLGALDADWYCIAPENRSASLVFRLNRAAKMKKLQFHHTGETKPLKRLQCILASVTF
jgi:hypothetical protein